jgi:hypothetical protein
VESVVPSSVNTVPPSASNKPKATSTKYCTSIWKEKSIAIFFYFDPSLGNFDAEATCKVFGIKHATFNNCVTKKTYYSKWVPFVSSFKLRDVFDNIPLESRRYFDATTLDMNVVVSIPIKYLTVNGKRFATGKSVPGSSRQKVAKRSSKSSSIVYIRENTRTVGSGRKVKYPVEEEFLISSISAAWEVGNPLSRPEIYLELMREVGNSDGQFLPATEFATAMSLNSGSISSSLSQWVKRRLEGNNWSLRKESVSQKVPEDWFRLALSACETIRASLKDCDVIINADEVFMNFYPRETTYVVPTGTKRVGSNVASDAKKACTLMVSCEMFSSMVLPPFIVMTGMHEGTLARRYTSWRDDGGEARVCFQPSHWMDIPTAKKYIDFLLDLFPGKKIGLIWDAASSHICQGLKDYTSLKDLVIGYIPAGLTSVLQVCDLYSNAPLKSDVKKRFLRWKISQVVRPGGKYKVDRKQVIHWIEDAIQHLNETQANERKVEYMFGRLGQDPRLNNDELFLAHLHKLEENEIYKSLLDGQRAEDLD